MLDLARHIIDTKRGKFQPERFEDRYDDALAALVKAKAEGKAIPKPKPPEAAKPIDLMEALRKSAAAKAKAKRRRSARPPGARPADVALETYRRKRDFSATDEPAGTDRRGHGDAFVVQKHAARRLHYDLRLEIGDALASWAVTRGPSLVPGDKRLAVHVEDHPLDYADFEGEIPKGQYGGGEVIVWDRGRWEPEGDAVRGLKKGRLDFTLEGAKLKGRWHLVRMGAKRGEKRENWLLIKGSDEAARSEADPDILEEEPASVISGRTVEDIAAGKPAKKPPTKPRTRSGKARDAFPGFVPPALATLKPKAPHGAGWVHEIKFDGYRLQAQIRGGKAKLLTRSGQDWTGRFGAELSGALTALPAKTAILDGELVVEGAGGASDFSALQADLSANRTDRFRYYLFDLLYLDGEDLRAEPLVARKDRLAALLKGAPEPLRLQGPLGRSSTQGSTSHSRKRCASFSLRTGGSFAPASDCIRLDRQRRGRRTRTRRNSTTHDPDPGAPERRPGVLDLRLDSAPHSAPPRREGSNARRSKAPSTGYGSRRTCSGTSARLSPRASGWCCTGAANSSRRATRSRVSAGEQEAVRFANIVLWSERFAGWMADRRHDQYVPERRGPLDRRTCFFLDHLLRPLLRLARSADAPAPASGRSCPNSRARAGTIPTNCRPAGEQCVAERGSAVAMGVRPGGRAWPLRSITTPEARHQRFRHRCYSRRTVHAQAAGHCWQESGHGAGQ